MNPELGYDYNDRQTQRALAGCVRRMKGLILAKKMVPMLRTLAVKPTFGVLHQTADTLHEVIERNFEAETDFDDMLRARYYDAGAEDALERAYRALCVESEFLEAVAADEGIDTE